MAAAARVAKPPPAQKHRVEAQFAEAPLAGVKRKCIEQAADFISARLHNAVKMSIEHTAESL